MNVVFSVVGMRKSKQPDLLLTLWIWSMLVRLNKNSPLFRSRQYSCLLNILHAIHSTCFMPGTAWVTTACVTVYFPSNEYRASSPGDMTMKKDGLICKGTPVWRFGFVIERCPVSVHTIMWSSVTSSTSSLNLNGKCSGVRSNMVYRATIFKFYWVP
jgi:hypothetical protein